MSEETLNEIEQFKKELNEYDDFLTRIENGCINLKDYNYDECNELRRRIQLDTEETIAGV